MEVLMGVENLGRKRIGFGRLVLFLGIVAGSVIGSVVVNTVIGLVDLIKLPVQLCSSFKQRTC
jgi:hypothetical protein